MTTFSIADASGGLPNPYASYQIANSISLFSGHGNAASPIKLYNAAAKSRNSMRTHSTFYRAIGNDSKGLMFTSSSPGKFFQRRCSDSNEMPKKTAECHKAIKKAWITYRPIGKSSPTLTEDQVTDIYLAKCRDLRLEKFVNREVRFQEYCRKHCVDCKIVLKEVYLLFCSSEDNEV